MLVMTPLLEDQLPDDWKYFEDDMSGDKDTMVYRDADEREFMVLIIHGSHNTYTVRLVATVNHRILGDQGDTELKSFHLPSETEAKATAVGYMQLADMFEQHYLEYEQ